ncbi:MAG: nucleotidyl transferase AbiEii/AbiGii toxin family protein [Candidatus Aegiribacteria sp.]|nr:nucleotidyl transferase AbiEii/AbiGii toxin family protein [Candidatus Aegiribacteria sp.]
MKNIIESRLEEYGSSSREARVHALREIVQEIALYSLSVNDFFSRAVFHGGTELRLVHGLPRFSEDLDFILAEPDNSFSWSSYEEALLRTCSNYGLDTELRTVGSEHSSIRRLLLIDTSILEGSPDGRTPFLRIRLEADVNPPEGVQIRTAFIDFPIPFEVSVMDLSSSFALKCHALLCRSWIKGRDWFDFLWFCSRDIHPDMDLLSSAIDQNGPWVNRGIHVTQEWLKDQLRRKIESLDWDQVARDVFPFLSADERRTLDGWKRELFIHYLHRLFSG